MRAFLAIAAIFSLTAVLVGCGDNLDKSSSNTQAPPISQELDKMFTSVQTIKSASFNASVQLQADASGADAQTAQILNNPISIKMNGKTDGTAGQVFTTIGLMGQSVQLGVKQLSNKQSYLQVGDSKWFLMPQTPSSPAVQLNQQKDKLSSQMAQIAVGAKQLLIGEGHSAKVNGVDVWQYNLHISSASINSLLQAAGKPAMPADELAVVDAVLKNAPITLSLKQSDAMPVQMKMEATIGGQVLQSLTANSDASTKSIRSLKLSVSIDLTDVNQPVTVDPPAPSDIGSAQELQSQVQQALSQFGILGALLGGSLGQSGGLGGQMPNIQIPEGPGMQAPQDPTQTPPNTQMPQGPGLQTPTTQAPPTQIPPQTPETPSRVPSQPIPAVPSDSSSTS